MRVGKLVRLGTAPDRLRIVGLLRDRTLSDSEVGGELFLVHDWSLVGSCPATFVEVEATVATGWPLEQIVTRTDDSPNPLAEWQLSNVRIVSVLGDDWLGDKTCERDVPPGPPNR